jgi:iron complex transport system substrate-binding protein
LTWWGRFYIDPRMRRRALLLLMVVAPWIGCERAEVGNDRDDLGRAVRIRKPVLRVVTLAPNLTEMVFALGSGQLVVGTDDFSDTPPAVRRLPHVGGLQPNVELIARLNPDLVIATTNGNHAGIAPALDAAHIPLFVVATNRLGDVPRAMARIGRLLDSPAAAVATKGLQRALQRQRRTRASRPSVLFAVWTDPLYVAARGTFIDDLFATVGARNAAAGTLAGWPQYSLESFAQHPPDLMIYPDHSVSAQQVARLLARVPDWSRAHRAVPVDENLFTRPGPRVAAAAAELNRILDAQERGR